MSFGKIDFKFQECQGMHFTIFPLAAVLMFKLDHRYYSIAKLRQWEGESLLCSGPNWCLTGTQATVSTPLSGWSCHFAGLSLVSFPPPGLWLADTRTGLFSGQAPAPVRKLTENHNCECQVRRRRRGGRGELVYILFELILTIKSATVLRFRTKVWRLRMMTHMRSSKLNWASGIR